MPYWVHQDYPGGNWIERTFDPPMKIELARPYLLGQELTEEYKASLSKVLRVKRPRKKTGPPDMIQDGLSAIWIVCKKLKDKLEELEPGRHEYLPIHVKRDNDSADYGIYHMVLLRQFLDAIDIDQTEFEKGFGLEAAERDRFTPAMSQERKRTLKSDVISGHHLWRGSIKNSRHEVFCSDEIAEFVNREGLRGWDLWPCDSA